jgi:uncharacterized protein YndB with AHSA1/START domain
MEKSQVVHHTFEIERTYPVPVERVFAAFADPAKKRRWYGERGNHEVEDFEHDFRVGGIERLRYRFKEGTPFPGLIILNEGTYRDLVPGERIVTASTMSFMEKPISVSLVTFQFIARDGATDLICTHQGAFFEGSDGPEMREAGWVTLLDRLRDEVAS